MGLKLSLVFGGVLFAVVACSDGDNQHLDFTGGEGADDESTTVEGLRGTKAAYADLTLAQSNDTKLVRFSGEEAVELFRNGLRYASLHGYGGPLGNSSSSGGVFGGASSSSAGGWSSSSSSSASSSSSGGFSQTNVHVEGVDEADITKYDGEYWYIATSPQERYYNSEAGFGFQVVAIDPETASTEFRGHYVDESISTNYGFDSSFQAFMDPRSHQATVTSDRVSASSGSSSSSLGGTSSTGGNGFRGVGIHVSGASGLDSFEGASYQGLKISGMYLVKDETETSAVATLSNYTGGLRVQLVDVEDPAAPELTWELNIEGQKVASRQIGNSLFLVTGHEVRGWEELVSLRGQDAKRDALIAHNETALNALDFEAVGAKYLVNGEVLPLSEDCYFPDGDMSSFGYLAMTYITKVDLDSKTVTSSCIGGQAEQLSMSAQSAYLTGTFSNEQRPFSEDTVIHKFKLTDSGAVYSATGTVEGILTSQGDPVSRLHEHEGRLRLLTSNGDWGDVHRLTILEESDNRLVSLATLPNDDRPFPIGKTGERVYSVRFTNDKAYVVTFRRTDPLYTIDLSEPGDPKITGALEIPGFSTYMHPFGNNYIFTVGVMEEQGPTGVRLFDVSGNEAVKVSSFYLSVSDEALYNLNAISLLQADDDTARVVLPSGSVFRSADWWLGLSTLEITGLTGRFAKIEQTGSLVVESTSINPELSAPSSGGSRGLIHGDAVFFSHGGATWGAHWGDELNVQGPVMEKDCLTTAQEQEGYTVTLKNLTPGEGGDMCSAEILASERDADGNITNIETLAPKPADHANVSCDYVGASAEPEAVTVTVKKDGWIMGRESPPAYEMNYCGQSHLQEQTFFVKSMHRCLEEAKPYAYVRVRTVDEPPGAECDATLALTVEGRNDQGVAVETYQYSATPVSDLTLQEQDDLKAYNGCVIKADHKNLFSPTLLHLRVDKPGYKSQLANFSGASWFSEGAEPCTDTTLFFNADMGAKTNE